MLCSSRIGIPILRQGLKTKPWEKLESRLKNGSISHIDFAYFQHRGSLHPSLFSHAYVPAINLLGPNRKLWFRTPYALHYIRTNLCNRLTCAIVQVRPISRVAWATERIKYGRFANHRFRVLWEKEEFKNSSRWRLLSVSQSWRKVIFYSVAVCNFQF